MTGFFPQTVNCWGSQCCLKCVRLGWGAVSASLSLSPVTQFVSPFVSHLTLAGVLCPPRWACLRSCLPICLPPGFVFHLGWGAVSASLGLSPNLSPTWLCLSPRLGCCVRLAGLVSQFVSHLALSLGLSAVLSPNLFPIWLWHPVFSPYLFPIWLCLSPWLGCCVLLLPTDLPTYLQRAELQVSRAVGRRPVPSLLLHRAVIKPPIHPPTLTLPTHHLIHPASVPAVACHQCGQPRSPKCSEATSGLQLCWVWPCQDYCLEPRPRKLSRACVGLAKRSPAAPWTEPFHGQTVCPMDRA